MNSIYSTMLRTMACLLQLFLLAACGEYADPNILRMGLASAPVNLDPRLATDAASSRVNRLLYRRLIAFDDRDRPVPDLAGWERIGPAHYRFQLRPTAESLEFTHGRRLGMADVRATLESILNPATGSPFSTQLEIIKRMQVLDERRMDFFLKRPDPLFPALLALEILPADLLKAAHPFHRQPIGNGPFRLLDWPQPGQLRLQRRRDGQITELIEVKDPGVRVLKLLRGEIDLLQSELPPELFGLLRENPSIRVEQRPGSNFSYIGFNLQDPELSRPAVRRAIALAIDREAIIGQVLDGAARPALALLYPGHWAGNPDLPPLHRDLQAAHRLLSEAGYDHDKPLELEYKTSSDPFRVRLATIIQAQLAEAGIRVRVRSLDWGTFFGDVKRGHFQMYSLTWVGVRTPDHFRYVFHGDSVPPVGANRGRYRSAVADSLIEKAEGQAGLAEQAGTYRQLQALLRHDLPYVPLWYEDQIMAVRLGVTGYALSADGAWDGLETISKVGDDG